MDRRSPPCALVIFGASGDLTARKLLPALERLAAYGVLPPELVLVGVARTPMTDEQFVAYCQQKVADSGNATCDELVAGARATCTVVTTTRRPTAGWPRCSASVTEPP